MEQWCEIRQRVLRDGESIRQIQRETGLHFDTIKKILAHPTPPAFRTPVRVKPKLGPYLERIVAILDSDRELPRKQRHTAKRIFQRLREEGYSGGYTQVKEAVRELKRSSGEVFVPLVHEPGEAQVDFGYALVKLAGSLRKVAFFALALPYSDAMFIAASRSSGPRRAAGGDLPTLTRPFCGLAGSWGTRSRRQTVREEQTGFASVLRS